MPSGAWDIDGFDTVRMQAARTTFIFYGFRYRDGSLGRGYFKLAHSLSEALTDLEDHDEVADEGYIVKDAFVEIETDDDGSLSATVHVELGSVTQSIEEIVEGDDDA